MLQAMGIEVGVDVNRLVEVARGLARTLGARLPGRVYAIEPTAAGQVLA